MELDLKLGLCETEVISYFAGLSVIFMSNNFTILVQYVCIIHRNSVNKIFQNK